MARRGSIPFSLTASEIAAMQLAGLPTTKRRVNARAEAEGWRYEPRMQRGGGRLYLTDDLPLEAKQDLRTRRRLFPEANAVAPKMGRPKGTGVFDTQPEIADAILTCLAARRLAAPRIAEMLREKFDRIPSLRSIQRFINAAEQEHAALLAAKRDPDGYKGRYRVALGRADADCTYAHEVWELDTTPADVMLKEGRMAILGVIDRWSRRAKFVVVPTESAQSVRRTLVETMRAWGVMPTAILTDNGSGYINETIRTALPLLGIEHRLCPPGTPEKKPHIERVFGTFTRERAELLDGYIGHNVGDAQKLRARAKKETGRAIIIPHMTSSDLQQILDAWVDGVYHQREHSTLRMSPMRKWMSSPLAARPAPSEEQLLLCLSAFVGIRTVGKRGVQWKKGRYWAPACAAWMGREIMVRRDEDDLGALFLFTPDGEYIDTAVNHERSGLSEAEFARWAQRSQAEFMANAKKELAAKSRNFDFDKMRAAVLRSDAEASGKLTYLQPRAAQRDAAVPVYDAPKPSAVTAPKAKTEPPSAAEMVARADRLIAAAAAGHDVDPGQLKWARNYADSPTYKTEKIMRAAFGEPKDAINSNNERKVS